MAPRNIFWVLILSCFCAPACVEREPGLHLEVLVDFRDSEKFSSFHFEILDVQVQPAGFEVPADHTVNDEWVPLHVFASTIDLHSSMNTATPMAYGKIPPGAYDRVFLRAKSLVALDENGQAVEIENVLEPTAIPFHILNGESLNLRLEVIVLQSPAGLERFSIFAKTASISE